MVLFLPAPFLFDAGVTLARRIVRGERWYEPHRTHYYQRLVRLGLPHRRVTVVYWGLGALAAVGVVAVASSGSPLAPLILAIEATLLGALAYTVTWMEKKNLKETIR